MHGGRALVPPEGMKDEATVATALFDRLPSREVFSIRPLCRLSA
jgi:hypothetical protein